MIDKCANPQCDERLVYLRSGLLYAVDPHRDSPVQKRHFFWLCAACSLKYKLQFGHEDDPHVVPINAPNPPYSLDSANCQIRHSFIHQPNPQTLELMERSGEGPKSRTITPLAHKARGHHEHYVRSRAEQRSCA